MALRTVKDYHKSVKRQVTISGCSNDWNSISYHASDRKKGFVSAEPLTFNDGATLKFYEEIAIQDDGTIERPVYSFAYTREQDGEAFFFRYDRDPVRAKPFIHWECHLHVNNLRANAEELRFKTHITNFGEVFGFIRACFYPSEH